MHKKFRTISILSLIIILITPFVFGATGDIFDKALKPLKNIHIAETYQEYYLLIDSILYFVLFINIAKAGFGEKFKDTNVPTIIGIILAIGMILFEYKSTFKLGPAMVVVGIIVAIIAIIKYFRKVGT